MRVGYCRVSTREQGDETNALEQQTARIEKAGCVLIFTDVESGRSDKRREFNKMLDLCKQQRIKEVVVTRIDRLARSVITIHRCLKTFEECGVELVILDAPTDASSPFGWFSITQMAGLAEFESRLLSSRIKHGIAYFREQKKASPQAPFGYTRIDEKYIPDLSLHKSGKPCWDIARETIDYFLTGNATLRSAINHCFLAYDKKWTQAGLRYWMTSPVLRGHTVYGRRGNDYKPENWIIHENTHQPLISEARYRLIISRLEENRHKYNYGSNKNHDRVDPLVGQIFCGCCSNRCFLLRGRNDTSPIRVRCKKHENLGESFCTNSKSTHLNKIVHEVDATLITRCQELQSYTISNVDIKDEDNPELVARQEQLKALKKLPQNLIIQSAIDQTLLEIQTIKQRGITVSQINLKLINTLVTCFADKAYWDSLSASDKKAVYKELIDSVKVLNGEILEIKLLV
jgi:site-specific DNA recombinase